MADLPLLALALMMKDEADSIRPLISSVRGIVDFIVLLDTGSKDATIALAQEAAGTVPLEIYEEPFVNFGATRSRVLDLIGTRAVFSLFLSGDEVLHHPEELLRFCKSRRGGKEGAYYVPVQLQGLRFDSARLARTANGWKYLGPVHEVLTCPTEPPPLVRVPKSFVLHDRKGATAEGMKRTWEGHVKLLLRDLEEHPDSSRSTFYLAQSYNCLGRYDEAIPVYEKRVALGGWEQEVFESFHAIGLMKQRRGDPWPETERAYLKAYAFHPHRAEPLYEIANYYRMKDDWPSCYTFARMAEAIKQPAENALFVDASVYAWRAADALAIACYYLGHQREGIYAAAKAMKACPGDERLKKNYDFFRARQKGP